MPTPVFSALLPVVILIALGFLSGRRGWIGGEGVRDLSNLVFVVLTPPLLFRTMSAVHMEQLDYRPLLSYFGAVAIIFVGTLVVLGFNRRGAVVALAGTFSNTVMIGIPLVALAFGEAGLVSLLPLISIHALVLLTTATVVLEVAMLREAQAAGDQASRPVGHTIAMAMRNALIHPVPLPIMAGLLFAWAGLSLPPVIDKTLQLLGNAFGPLALLLVGVTLARTHIGPQWRGALGLSMVKNVLHPLLVVGIAWVLGLRGVPLAVMVVAGALPIGANVFLFSQRYAVAQDLVTASVAISTLMAIASVSVILAVLG